MTSLILCASLALGQSLSPQAAARLGDGSLLFVTVQQESLEVATKYGTLTIPFADIRSIDLGSHFPGGEKTVLAHIEALGADNHAAREKAGKSLLAFGPGAYPYLLQATKSQDLEVKQRASQLVKALQASHPADKLRTSPDDTITTDTLKVTGRIVAPSIKVHAPWVGDLNLKLHDLASVRLHGSGQTELTVEAGADWRDTGWTMERGTRLVATASGEVDLWTQQPGQYMSSPQGAPGNTGAGQVVGGALVGKVGTGEPFLIGTRYVGTVGEGRLFLKITPSPWPGAQVAGGYTVKLRIGN